MTWPPNNQPTGGKSDSTPMATDHPTEHNAIKATLDDIIAENAGALPLAGGTVTGDLQVDGAINAGAGRGVYFGGNWQGVQAYNTNSSDREFMVIGNGVNGSQIQLHGNNDSKRPGKVDITGALLVNGSPIGLFSIADGIDTTDVLERAEVATMPAVDDEGAATADAEVESVTVNEVVTALLAKVKEQGTEIATLTATVEALTARIEALET